MRRARRCAGTSLRTSRTPTGRCRATASGRSASSRGGRLRRARAGLMWAALANGGKTLAESDPEVSEAVDFVEFYRASARYFLELGSCRREEADDSMTDDAGSASSPRRLQARGRGVIVVV